MKRLTPSSYAFVLAGGYFGLSVAWLAYQSRISEEAATSISDFALRVLVKGTIFRIISAVALYYFTYRVFSKMRSAGDEVVRSRQRLVEAEREAIPSLLAASIAHDFANLLTIMRLNIECLDFTAGENASNLAARNRIDQGILRLTELTARMRSAGQNLLREPAKDFDLVATIKETLDLVRLHGAAEGCEIDFDASGRVSARGYPVLVHQLIMNLVLNAAEATKGFGKIKIRAHRGERAVLLDVDDNGPGIPVGLRNRVFDAFYSTKDNGTGLGLMSAKSCVEISGGDIQIVDSNMGGAGFRIRLPDINKMVSTSHKDAKPLNEIRASENSASDSASLAAEPC